MDVIAAHAARHPARAALVAGARVVSWAELHAARNRLAHGLAALGHEPGQHAVVYAENAPEYLLASAGLRAAGMLPVPMNHRLVAEEVAYILISSRAPPRPRAPRARTRQP